MFDPGPGSGKSLGRECSPLEFLAIRGFVTVAGASALGSEKGPFRL